MDLVAIPYDALRTEERNGKAARTPSLVVANLRNREIVWPAMGTRGLDQDWGGGLVPDDTLQSSIGLIP